MKLEPVISEKTLGLAKEGKYTFRVPTGFSKPQIRESIGKLFDVNVISIRTSNVKGESKRNNKGFRRMTPSWKKAIVALKKDQKIDLFEEKKK